MIIVVFVNYWPIILCVYNIYYTSILLTPIIDYTIFLSLTFFRAWEDPGAWLEDLEATPRCEEFSRAASALWWTGA